MNTETSPDDAGDTPPLGGLSRAVLTALESNIKTARLIAIILACATTIGIVLTLR